MPAHSYLTAGYGPIRAAEQTVRLCLLSGFQLTIEGRLTVLSASAQRLLALLAIRDRWTQRVHAAGVLWPEATEDRALGNLRTILWRLRRYGVDMVQTDGALIRLAATVDVDTRRLSEVARQFTETAAEVQALEVRQLTGSGDLLPDWYDDWVLIERERLRQLRLHMLEVACAKLAGAGRYGEAVAAGVAAVECEPLRESANRALVQAHLAEGNAGEALRQYRWFRDVLHRELGLRPTPQMETLVAPISLAH
jgi:DNA-binding SARP family transcriptional activator